jgi:hypothetical protein
MKHIFTRLLLLIFIIICQGMTNAFAQPGVGISFTYSSLPSFSAYPTAAPNVNQIIPAANQDDFGYLFAPAGMSVNFAGNTYQKIVVSTNGWVALVPNSVAAIPASLSAGNYLSTNQLAGYAGGFPILAPFWDDIATTLISYNFTGGALWVRWTSKIDKTNTSASNLFWIRIDGTTGVIDYFYNNTAYTIFGTPSASIGLAGVCTGDYYSYNFPASSTWADSTIETSTISTRPVNLTYTFTPFQLYDNCVNAKDLGTASATCIYNTFNINNATGASPVCSTTDQKDIWFRFIKPLGMLNVTVSTMSASPACQSVTGTSVEVYSSCATPISGACSTTSTLNPGFGEVTVSRSCAAETLYVRVTSDGDVAGKFKICIKDGGGASATGTTCANPTWICSLPYTQNGLTTAGFGSEYDSANSVCHDPFMNGEDYVFAFTPPTNTCIRIAVSTTGALPGLFVFDGCPNIPSTHCIASTVNSVGPISINSVSLIAGTTYYILVDNDTLGSAPPNIPFDINVTSVGTSQAYDACGAISLGSVANNQPCTFSSYTTECSTPSAVSYPVPTCGSFTNGVTGDIWLSFTAVFTGALLIKAQPGGVNPSNNIAMAVYTGTCASFNMYACDDNSAGSNMPLLSLPVINGTTYYIRLWTPGPGNPGGFSLCISSACTPANDLPCTAVFIAPGGSASGYNTCSSSGGEPVNTAQCVAGGIINTVWYKTVVPASGMIKVRTHTHSLTDTQIEAFLFPTGCSNAATSFTRKGCNDDAPDCGPDQGGQSYHDFSDLSINSLTPGDTVWIAVDGYNSQTGTFEITIIDGISPAYPPIAGADCAAATDVCGPTSIVSANPGILGYGNICDFQNSYDCWLNGERNSQWYNVTVNPGILQFDVQTLSDYDFIMWDVTNVANACQQIQAGTLPSIRCNWVTTVGGHTGISTANPNADWEPSITVTGGPRNYLILIDNWNPPFIISGYTLDWMGSPIATNVSSVTWQGAIDTMYSNPANWGTAPCNAQPTCSIDANISAAGSGHQPTINANMAVKNLTINPGASLRIKSPFVLDVCGNFTNNGTLICEPGSTIRFIGTANQNQVISGNLTGSNAFSNFVIFKPPASGNVTLNNNLDVTGNFSELNVSSILNINGKYMKVGGHFTNFNGNATFTGIAGSTVEFNGILNQNFTNSNGTINLNRVKMNKASGKLYLTGASSTMNVDSILTLTSGQIVTASFEVNLKYYLPAALVGGSALSFIDGKFRRKIANGILSSPIIPASYDFPLGDSITPGGYELANITFTSATLVNDLLAQFIPWSATPPMGPVASECVFASYHTLPLFNHGYWKFQRSTGVFSGNYKVTLFNTGQTNQSGNGFTVVTSKITSDPLLQSSWFLLGNCVIASTSGNTQRTNFNPLPGNDTSSFNHYYTTAQTPLVLPIELLSFTAMPKGEGVICEWKTASETNNEYFDVEKSIDSREFESIGRIKGFGMGTSTNERNYSLTDQQICNGIQYYRLRQVDFDGQYSYSDVIAVDCSNDKDFLKVFPNPAKSAVTVSFYQIEKGIVRLECIDIIGKVVKDELRPAVTGYNRIDIDISDLSKGIYYLRIQEKSEHAGQHRQIKLVKD